MLTYSKLGLGAALALAVTVPAFANGEPAGAVTFAKDVLPIFHKNCVGCHRPGGDSIAGMVAPMSLMNFEEARPWAKAIEKMVTSKLMPPWYASEETHGVFANERGLTPEQIELVATWVRTGAKLGNPADAPASPVFPETGGWLIGNPDLIVPIKEPYWVEDDVVDEYVYFSVKITPEMLPEDRWLRAIEWRPDSDVVHHIVGSELFTADGKMGYQGMGSIAPGEEPHVFEEGYGKRLHAGSVLRFSMHYHKEPGKGSGRWDQSSVGFRFWDDEKDPPIKHNMIWTGISNGTFEIPPGQSDWQVGAAMTFERDALVVSLHPHMHLRGKDATYFAVLPDGSREQLLRVPSWDFAWQLDYTFKEPRRFPKGTRIEFVVTYDNSTANAANPDATVPVHWGGPTTDEMMIGFMHYTDAEPRDFAAEAAAKPDAAKSTD